MDSFCLKQLPRAEIILIIENGKDRVIVAIFGFVNSPSIGKAITVNFLNDNLRFTLVSIHSCEIV